MKVFIPHKKDPNPFFDEILSFSEMEYIFANMDDYSSTYPIVNIHWPEALLDWQIPTSLDIAMIESRIQIWKRTSTIVYTRHDDRHNFSGLAIYKELFRLIENAADVFIHLGEYSRKLMEQKFPEKNHVVIPHPLYENSFTRFEKSYARAHLKIKNNATVMVAPGRIRNIPERTLVLSAFNAIPGNEKSLLSNRMLPFQSDISFRGKHRLNKIVNVDKLRINHLNNKYKPPKYIFNYNFIDFHTFSLMMSASDFVFIPRMDILNSGNVFLGFTYKKPVVGPISGNITEYLKRYDFPLFNPHSKISVKSAVGEVMELTHLNEQELYHSSLEKFRPAVVANELDNLFKLLRHE